MPDLVQLDSPSRIDSDEESSGFCFGEGGSARPDLV